MHNANGVVIASGEQESTGANIFAQFLVGIEMPDAWTAADLQVQGRRGHGPGPWQTVYGSDGNAITLTVGADRIVWVDPTWFMACDEIRVVATVVQGAERTLYLLTRDER